MEHVKQAVHELEETDLSFGGAVHYDSFNAVIITCNPTVGTLVVFLKSLISCGCSVRVNLTCERDEIDCETELGD